MRQCDRGYDGKENTGYQGYFTVIFIKKTAEKIAVERLMGDTDES